MAKDRPIIAVDIDDVLADSAKGLVEYSNKKWGTHLTPDDYDDHWALMWGVDEQEAEKRAVEYIHKDMPGIVAKYSHDEEAEPVLRQLSRNYKLIIVTSRRRAIEKDTLEWLEDRYAGLFEETHFAGIWEDLSEGLYKRLSKTKGDLLKSIKADYLIDDQPKHCVSAAEQGITAILFGNYRWNRDVELRPNMVRAKNWQEVLDYFERQSS